MSVILFSPVFFYFEFPFRINDVADDDCDFETEIILNENQVVQKDFELADVIRGK